MKLENQDLIEEFYELNKDKYPDLTFEQVKGCISTPFLHTKKCMENGKLPTIRLKYFGTFMIFNGKAESALRNMKKAFEELRMPGERYFKQKKMIEEFLKRQEDDKIIE